MIDQENVPQSEATPPEQTQPSELVQTAEPEVQPETTPEPVKPEAQPDTSKEKNLRILRERAERAERERDELLRRQEPAKTEEDDIGIGNDDFAEGKHLRKLSQEIKQLKAQLANSSLDATEARLKSQYPDFDNVVSKENLEQLRDAYPEIALSLNSNPDMYAKAKSAYTIIKKLGIMPEENFEQEKAIAKKNMAKPKPLASIAPQQGTTPLSKVNAFVNDFSKESLDQTWKEMKEILGE